MTLLFAVCEQALSELDPAEPADEETVAAIASLRDHLAALLPRDRDVA
jgi:hypothetical protein